jgi:hypothetical protein
MGAIWLGLDPNDEISDYAALILHEYVHQCLFLEDMVRSIFIGGKTDLAVPDALVTSALRRTPRGYDKSFHSAFVAVTLSRLYAPHAIPIHEPMDAPVRRGRQDRTAGEIGHSSDATAESGSTRMLRGRRPLASSPRAEGPARPTVAEVTSGDEAGLTRLES